MGVFGLRGEVKVQPLTDFQERFDAGSRLRLRGEWVTLEASRQHGGQFILRLEGVSDPDAARALQWQYLEAPPIERETLAAGEYLVSDLVGMSVRSMDGMELGRVEEVLPYPAQDILKIGDLLIPMVDEFVAEVDIDKRLITVNLLPGMLSPEDAVEG